MLLHNVFTHEKVLLKKACIFRALTCLPANLCTSQNNDGYFFPIKAQSGKLLIKFWKITGKHIQQHRHQEHFLLTAFQQMHMDLFIYF